MEAPHVVVFPYDEQGHVTPAFALARALASKGLRVTGVLTITRYALLSTASAPPVHDQPPLFSIEAVPEGPPLPPPVPAAACDGDQLQQDDDVCFHQSLQKLEPGFLHLLQRLHPPPSCLISDLLYPWTQDLADRLGFPRFNFSVFPALTLLVGCHTPALISKGLLPFQPGREEEAISFIPGLPKFRLGDVPVDSLVRDRKQLEMTLRVQKSFKRAAGMVINTLHDLEPDFVDALRAEGLSVYTVGPMGVMDWEGHLNKMPSLFPEDEDCLRWLDHQPRGGVVYVAFGSLVSLTKEEIREVALGLEACEQPFLWVLRRSPTESFDPMTALPDGFQERMEARGCVVSWAPQAAVLAHKSIGCFLSHCGMGSVLEAMWAGVPIIGGFGKLSDQNTNLWLVTKLWGVGMALQDRDAVPPVPVRCAIEMRVKEMVHGDGGKAVSRNAVRMKTEVRKAVEPNGSSYRNLNELAVALKRCIPWSSRP